MDDNLNNDDSLYLRGARARELRALGHHLAPMVMVGKEGPGEAVTCALEAVFCAHELVKVKIQEGCPEEKTIVAVKLAAASDSQIVQLIGRTILLYRARPEQQEAGAKAKGPAGRGKSCFSRDRGRSQGRGGKRGRKRAGGAGGSCGSTQKKRTIRSLTRR